MAGLNLHVPGLKSEVPGLRPGKTRLKGTPADTHTHTLLKIKQKTCMMKKGVKHYKLNKHQLINER